MLTPGKVTINGWASWVRGRSDAQEVQGGCLLCNGSPEHRAGKRQVPCPLGAPWLVW